MSDENKILKFEEWWPRVEANGGHREHRELCRKVWNAAREGMIPADQAIKVPPVEEWPRIATEIGLAFHCTHDNSDKSTVWCGDVEPIPRPASAVPKWTPKVGDKVFLNNPIVIIIDQPGLFPVCVIEEAHNGRFVLKGIPNLAWHIDSLKPFDESKLGKTKWEDI